MTDNDIIQAATEAFRLTPFGDDRAIAAAVVAAVRPLITAEVLNDAAKDARNDPRLGYEAVTVSAWLTDRAADLGETPHEWVTTARNDEPHCAHCGVDKRLTFGQDTCAVGLGDRAAQTGNTDTPPAAVARRYLEPNHPDVHAVILEAFRRAGTPEATE